MSELPDGIRPADPPNPRPSASGIVLERSARSRFRVLLGTRSRRSRFMPGHLAFPGGGLDPQDGDGAGPEAFSCCVARELREETGLDIDAARWIDVGERTTPPMFPVRFYTRFFAVWLGPDELVGDLVPTSQEIETLELCDPAEVIERWRAATARVPPPVLSLLRALAEGRGRPDEDVAELLREANAQEERAPRIEFVPDIWMLPVRTVTLPPATHTNVWIPGGRQFAVMDPGCADPEELERLIAVVDRRRAEGHEPSVILLTHGHGDHAAGAETLARRLSVPVRASASVLDALDPGVRGAPLEDGEQLDLDGMSLTAIATPGHAAGHVAFHVAESRVLIAGDLVSGVSTILIDPDSGDMGAYLDSLARTARLDCRQLLPGHGPPLPGRAIDYVRQHRRDREQRILAALGVEPLSLSHIARAAYDDASDMPAALTRRQALAHLLWLEREGRAHRADGSRGLWVRTQVEDRS